MIPVWIAKIDVLDANNSPTSLYFADGAFIDDAWNYYEPRMLQPALVKISPSDGGTFHCFSSPSIGEIELNNVDFGLNYLADYAVDNGNCTLSLIDANGFQIDYLTGKISGTHWTDESVFLTLQSMSEILARPHINTKYLGNNVLPAGVEGVATDIFGNIKPRVFGSVKNATPVLVNTAQLIYQFSDISTCSVTAVYDKGSTLTLGTTYTQANFATFQTATVTAGTFNTCMGYVKLGVLPTGAVTGDAIDGTGLAGDVFAQIISQLIFVPVITFDTVSKTALNAVGKIGIFVTSETTTAALLDQIVASIGAIWYFNGSVVYAQLIALATTYTLELTDSEMITLERTGVGLGTNGVPICSVSITYDKIETVQTQTDLIGSLTADKISYLANATRNSFIVDSTVLTRHPMSESLTISSCLRNSADATSVATRLLALAKVRVDVVNITAVVSQVPALTIGRGVLVTTQKLSYDDGKILTIIGFEINAESHEITLECIG